MRLMSVAAILSLFAVSGIAQERMATARTKNTAAIKKRSAQLTVVPMLACGSNPGNISCNTSVSESLSSASCYVADPGVYFDGYRINLTSLVNVDVRLSSPSFDAFLVLVDESTEEVVLDDDDSGGGTNARLRGTVDPGTYILLVSTALENQIGGYTLVFSCSSASTCTTTAIQCGESLTDTLRNTSCQLPDGSYYLWYRFEGAAGTSVTIEMSSTSGIDPYLFLFLPSGEDIQDDDGGGGTNSRIQTILPETGTYYIIANSYQPDTFGSFNLSLTCQSPGAACVAGPTVLCLDDSPGDRRYGVTVRFQTTQGAGSSGDGRAIQTNSLGVSRGGLFWFFGADNPELLIKVLDGCPANGKKWIFYSAGTNVGLNITVSDTRTGLTKTYTNPDRQVALPIQDTSAFPCP